MMRRWAFWKRRSPSPPMRSTARARRPIRAPWPLHSGTPLEWYTLAENLFRAYDLTKNDKYREFAEVWLYTPYWTKFLDAEPKDVWGVHAYSHVNSFSSCAMAYAVTGDQKYLQILKNAYDFMQNTQCFATGGYGPVERLMPPNGNLGVSLELRQNSCEVPCCSWAAFKMARYLMTFTGEREIRRLDRTADLQRHRPGLAHQRQRRQLLLRRLPRLRWPQELRPLHLHLLLRHLHPGRHRVSQSHLLQRCRKSLRQSLPTLRSYLEPRGRPGQAHADHQLPARRHHHVCSFYAKSPHVSPSNSASPRGPASRV